MNEYYLFLELSIYLVVSYHSDLGVRIWNDYHKNIEAKTSILGLVFMSFRFSLNGCILGSNVFLIGFRNPFRRSNL